MKKQIYFYSAALLAAVMFVGCADSADESLKPTEKQAKNGDANVYDNYRLIGNIEDGWYNSFKEDCSAKDTVACISITIIVSPGGNPTPDAEFIFNLRTKKAKDVFLSNKRMAYKFFDKIVVDGVIDSFFDLEWTYNNRTTVDHFKIKRIKDGQVVGVKPFQIKR